MTWNRTRVASKLGIVYPIIQGPLGGFASQHLTAAVSSCGGLGSFGAHGLAPAAIAETIGQLKSMTDKPFAINLWVSTQDDGATTSDREAFERSRRVLAPYLRSLGVEPPSYTPHSPASFEQQVRALLEARAPVFSFVFGIPPRETLDECRALGIVTVGTATTPEEAVELRQADVDLIVAAGFEAGGHRGSFLRAPDDSLIGTFSLVPRIADLVSTPVIAAGGVADARGIAAAFALGAEGVQIGTAFLACDESGASALHRAVLHGDAPHTALTRGFTGRLGRGIDNELLRVMNAPSTEILPYPLQRWLLRALSGPADAAGRADIVPMWAGQSAALVHHTKARELFDSLVGAASVLLDGAPAHASI
jgi:nitronate monooxygenase